MDVAPPAVVNTGDIVKDELAEKCQKLFQAFLEEWVFSEPIIVSNKGIVAQKTALYKLT